MRILAITNLYPNPLQPHRGTFNRPQFRALADRHEVRVISPIAWTDEWALRNRGVHALPGGRHVVCDGLPVHHPRYVFTPKILRNWYGHFFRHGIAQSFSSALAEFRPEVVLSAWAYPDGWAAVDLGHRAGLPVVVKVHGSDVLTLARIRGRGRRTAEALRDADAVIAVSHDLAHKVIEMGARPERVSVVYDGIDATRFHPGPKRDARGRLEIAGGDPILLFVGNLVPVKGLDILVDACTRLHRCGLRFRCFLVGQGPLERTLRRQIRRSGLEERLTLVGPIAHAHLPDWFRAADLFVLPSRSEGVPCVLLEAAACQTPFVATRVGGIPEIAHLNDGRLVAPADPAALAHAIARMLAQPARPRPQRGFSRGHDDAAREIEAVLQRVLGPRTCRAHPPDIAIDAQT